ncbi:MAG: nucleotide exchange factor GrpE [Wenzhouxiangella sp.]
MAESNDREVEKDALQPDESAEPQLEGHAEGASEQEPGRQAEQEMSALRDALLRTRAEMDNLQKRSERELDKARRFINEGLMKDLVPVLDTFDQALENTPEEAEAQRQGLLLLQKQLLQSLERHGLQVLHPHGEGFNPEWHEAMSLQPSAEHEPDTVLMVLQRGYTLHGRLLRPARVIVSREV